MVIARRLATAALWVRIQTSLKNQKRAIYYISIRAANRLQPGKIISLSCRHSACYTKNFINNT